MSIVSGEEFDIKDEKELWQIHVNGKVLILPEFS